jgi:hypothetical protein
VHVLYRSGAYQPGSAVSWLLLAIAADQSREFFKTIGG